MKLANRVTIDERMREDECILLDATLYKISVFV